MQTIQTNTVPTVEITIHCGLYNRDTGITHRLEDAKKVCQQFVDEVGQCVSVTATEYIYTRGHEPGLIVGFINYPRFPSDLRTIENQAVDLATRLMLAMEQYRVSVITPERTLMLSNPNIKK